MITPKLTDSPISDQISMCAEVNEAESCIPPSTWVTNPYDTDKVQFFLKE